MASSFYWNSGPPTVWFWVVLKSLIWSSISAQFMLYETDRINPLEFDCLHYYANEEQFRGAQFKNPVYQRISYCRRPTDVVDEIPYYRTDDEYKFTFEQLSSSNITATQLLRWSASVALAEQYSLYISQATTNHYYALDVFVNCTEPWFGPACQYSFDLGPSFTLSDVVGTTFLEKSSFSLNRHRITNLTCYQLLECNRGVPMCLDWREVCNGRVDCIDGGADEEHCYDLEMNECAEDEYRCHNGLCIPRDFLHDDRNNPDCLDRTDEVSGYNTFDSCFKDPTFRCEEQTCHPNFGLFPCGDGQCEPLFGDCKNDRGTLLKEAALIRGNLSVECWMSMVCLTGMNETINGKQCSRLFVSSTVIENHLKTCEPLFQFPVNPIVLGHVRFMYYNNHSDVSISEVLPPDLVCFDFQLCDFLEPTFRYGDRHCQPFDQILSHNTTDYVTLLQLTAQYFRLCSSRYPVSTDVKPVAHCCTNSSKCISKHRLVDLIQDCPQSDDEKYLGSCRLNQTDRFLCNDVDMKCYAPIHDTRMCQQKQKQNHTQIFFHQLCDGVDNFVRQTSEGQSHTDETDCESWPCSNLYTRCDDYWNCPNGEDELNCIRSNCSPGLRPCISPIDYQLTCLSQKYVQDGKIDCLGASDEFQLCQTNPKISPYRYRYRCWNDTKCTGESSLCNGKKECRFHDDEKFCSISRVNCSGIVLENHREIDETICQLFSWKIEKRVYFTLENVEILPSKEETPSKLIETKARSRPDDAAWSWRCNRGLYVRLRDKETQKRYKCLCPPSYYGDACQYQSQRVSLTLGFLVADRFQLYCIVVSLMNGNREVIAYEQFPFMGDWGCSRSFNIYFLYPSRPKNMSENYSIHIDAFERISLVYVGSWHLPIPFLFLPVNRVTSQLTIPVRPVPIVHSCPLNCKNSEQCHRYVNMEQFFCRCPAELVDHQCEQSSHCNSCSSDSICLGSIEHRPICVCPLNRVGPRCLLTAVCPSDRCMNDGRCVLIDHSAHMNNYICICTESFHGPSCEWPKQKLEILLDGAKIASYMLAHLITVSNSWKPTAEVVIKKSTRDQNTVVFYLETSFHLIFIQLVDHYYLVRREVIPNASSTAWLGRLSRCSLLEELYHGSQLVLPRIQLVKTYHVRCQIDSRLSCFYDGYYMCLCTSERHANCFELGPHRTLTCHHNDYCQNGGSCYRDDHTCPVATVCVCVDCYFGTQCQFFAKGFGLTLDDILRYEIRRHLHLSQQSLSVKTSAILTGLMLGMGFVSSALSYLTFRRQNAREVGCGSYLFASSITSFLTVMILTMKFWVLVCSQLDVISSRTTLRVGCIFIEPALKVFFYFDRWLQACVAVERSIMVFRGVSFSKAKSVRVAKRIIFSMPILIIASTIHESIYRELVDTDEMADHRNWCVTRYSTYVQSYNSIIVIAHFLTPFLINFISALLIILSIAHRRMTLQNQHSYRAQLKQQLNEHKHMVISPIILIVLSSPRLIISLMSSCIESEHDPALYLSAYFVSFTPSVLTFVVFVLPSDLYRGEFKKYFCRRFNAH